MLGGVQWSIRWVLTSMNWASACCHAHSGQDLTWDWRWLCQSGEAFSCLSFSFLFSPFSRRYTAQLDHCCHLTHLHSIIEAVHSA